MPEGLPHGDNLRDELCLDLLLKVGGILIEDGLPNGTGTAPSQIEASALAWASCGE